MPCWLQRSFDVILLDLNLPDSSGMETCRRMSGAAGQVPIIVLTGAEDEAIAAEAMRLGVQDYLVKGQAYGSVIGRTIRYAVERSQAQEALRQANERLQEQAEEVAVQAKNCGSPTRNCANASRPCTTPKSVCTSATIGRRWAPASGRSARARWSGRKASIRCSATGRRSDAHARGVPGGASIRRTWTATTRLCGMSLDRCEDYACAVSASSGRRSVRGIEARGQSLRRQRGRHHPADARILADIDGQAREEACAS